MDVRKRLAEAAGLTPTEAQLAQTVLAMGERVQQASIKELAVASATSIATVHRLCKKLGLEGFKELKVELARSYARQDADAGVDFDFPFDADWDAGHVARSMRTLYAEAIEETLDLLDVESLGHAAELLRNAQAIDVYTQSHNLYPAQMFCDRLLSAGRVVTCQEHFERQVRTAFLSDEGHVAVMISYSGVSNLFDVLLPLFAERGTPVVLVGAPMARDRNPGLAAYLLVSDSESTLHRITQFASHISVQFVLDVLFGCVVSGDYDRSLAYIRDSFSHTRKLGV